jgi:hypothetical protein
MNDQLEHPENSAAEGSTPADAQSGASANSGGDGGETQPAAGGPVAPKRRPLKKRKAAPKRRAPHPTGTGAAATPHAPHHYDKLVDEGEDEGFFGRHRTKVVIGVVALLAVGVFYFLGTAKHSTTTRAPEKMVVVSLPPPLPPPPPPPPKKEPPPPKQEQKMEKETAAEEKPKEEAPKAPEPPKETLGTGVKGNGPGIAGLGASGNGGGFGGPKGGGGGSKYGYYAGMVQSKVTQALQSNSRTRVATMEIVVRIWPDSTGRITRAELGATTGDSKLDAAIRNEVLTNLQLSAPPPPGMPLPIVMRLTARKR